MLNMSRLILLNILVSLLLIGCSSSPQVNYYTLSPANTAFSQDGEEAVTLGLGPLRLPEYMNRSQMVTRGAGAELQVHEFNRWAEPLGPAINRIVSTDVDSLLDGVVVYTFPYEAMIRNDVDYRLLGDINRFEADSSGLVVLETQWGVASTESELVVLPRRGRYTAQAARPNDPASIAVAMNEALVKFSRDIAKRFGDAVKNLDAASAASAD
jgi:uncharacterized lipoprotein YmbA